MVLSKSAVEDFYKGQPRDLRWIKKKSRAWVDKRVSKIRPRLKFEVNPMWHQRVCYILGCSYKRFMFSCDTGTGKSKIALDILRYRKRKNKLGRTIIVVKNDVALTNWAEEIDIHAPELTYDFVEGTYMEKLETILTSEADLLLVHYPGMTHLCSLHDQSKKHTGLGPQGRKKKGKQHWETNHRLIDDIIKRYDCIVFDEIHKIKNHNSLPHRILRKISDNMKFVYGLTGTPFGRDPTDLWGEMKVIDMGETLGQTLELFRHAFFVQEEDRWAYSGVKWVFDKRKKVRLHKKMGNRAIRFAARECFDLPRVKYIPVHYKIPASTLPYYKALNEEFKAIYKDYKAAEGTFVRMRQVCSGFMGAKADNKKIELVFPYNPKLEALLGLIEDLEPGEKFIVMHEFRTSNSEICKALNKAKIKHVSVMGGTKDAQGKIQAFKTDPKVQGLVGSWSSIGESLNLQVAKYLFLYETPVSPLDRKQVEARIIRKGQKSKHVFIFDFIAKGSVEVRIQAMLRDGKSLFQAIMDGKFKNTDLFDEEEYV